MADEEDDEDAFGDFKFFSSSPSPLPHFNPNHQSPSDDDEWGDFVETPLEFPHPSNDPFLHQQPFYDPFVSSQDSNLSRNPLESEANRWEKPKGAIPLSIFGDEDKEEEEEEDEQHEEHPNSLDLYFNSRGGFSPNPAKSNGLGFNSVSGTVKTSINDLLADLYGQSEQIRVENGVSVDLVGGKDDFDENGWEFKEAYSGDKGQDGDFFSKDQMVSKVLDTETNTFPSGESQVYQFKMGNGVKSDIVEENIDFDDDGWEFKDAFSEIRPTTGNFGLKKEHQDLEILEDVVKSSTYRKSQGAEERRETIHHSSPFTNGKLDFENLFDVQDGIFLKPTANVKNGIVSSGPDLNDLISTSYSQCEQVSAVNSTQKFTKNGYDLGLNSDLINDNYDWSESCWEFKDAFPETRSEDHNSGSRADMHQNIPKELKLKKFVDLYSMLKEESWTSALCHLDRLKKAKVSAALSGEDEKVMALNEEIQLVYEKLREANEAFREEYPPKKDRVTELLEVVQDPDFRVLELEYQLPQQILLVEKDLNSAVRLFKHASFVLHIMSLASMDEQTTYISAWSELVLVCTQELRHGSMIWKQSMQRNVHTQILSNPKGLHYLFALGEIYRAAEILRASTTLYKPWIMLNFGDAADLLGCLEECTAIWSGLGLKEALEGISSNIGVGYHGSIKILLESIKSIHGLDADALRNHVSSQKDPICRLSLLSLGSLQDINVVQWNGESYLVKLANLWANMISSDPPHLPDIYAREQGNQIDAI